MDNASPIRTRSRPRCHVCGGRGDVAYHGLHDRIYGAPGEWTLRKCLNEDCGLLWLDPMPVEEDLPRLYATYYTHSEPTSPSPTPSFRRAVKKAFWKARYGPAKDRSRLVPAAFHLTPGLREWLALQVFDLEVIAGGRLLEVGCGNGETLARLAWLGWNCEGVDFDEKAVTRARERRLEAYVGSLHDRKYPDGAFDAVVMNHVLEHVPDPRGLFVECHRILKPGGHLVCITPNAASWAHAIFGRNWRDLDPPRHLHIFNIVSLRKLLSEMNWERQEVRSSVANTNVIVWASSQLRRLRQLDVRSRAGRWGRVWSRAFQMVAAIRRVGDEQVGDELVSRAVKR